MRLVFFRRLEAETDEALKEQDEKLGKILGKLQVSWVIFQCNSCNDQLLFGVRHHFLLLIFYTIFYFKVAVARREEIIKRQDEAIRSLEVTQLLITFFLLITGKFVYLVIPLAVGSFEVSIYIWAESL